MRLRNKFVLGLGTIALTAMPLVTSAVVEKNTDVAIESKNAIENNASEYDFVQNYSDIDNDENLNTEFLNNSSEVQIDEKDGPNIVNQQLSELIVLKKYYHLNEKPMPRSDENNEWFIETFELALKNDIKDEWVVEQSDGTIALNIPTEAANDFTNFVHEVVEQQNIMDLFVFNARSWQWITANYKKTGFIKWYYNWEIKLNSTAIERIDILFTLASYTLNNLKAAIFLAGGPQIASLPLLSLIYGGLNVIWKVMYFVYNSNLPFSIGVGLRFVHMYSLIPYFSPFFLMIPFPIF